MLESAAFLHHPVTQAEVQYQERIMENTRAGSVWVGLAYLMTYPALLLSIVVYLSALASQIIPGSIVLTFDQNSIALVTVTLIYLIAMSIALYVVVTLVTLGLSSNSISREKQGKTWDALLLTGVDARQLVWGKWWATMRTFWKDIALVWMLRLSMIVWLIVVTDGEFIYRLVVPQFSPELAYLLVGAFMVAAYTLLDAMLTAALGQIAALADRRTGIVVFLALVIRLLTLFAPLVLPFLIYTHFEMHEASFYIGFWGFCLGVYIVLIWLLLRVGQWLATRQRALPPVR
jgi:hypothetical protein